VDEKESKTLPDVMNHFAEQVRAVGDAVIGEPPKSRFYDFELEDDVSPKNPNLAGMVVLLIMLIVLCTTLVLLIKL
jgi:hypothetical protein